MKALSFKVEGQSIEIPSHVDLVVGLDDYVNQKIAAYDASTMTTKFAGLANVYLKRSEQAATAAQADLATTATRAVNDADGNPITSTYYKKTDVVERAINDSEGLAIHTTYAKKNGSIESATTASRALVADQAAADSGGVNINQNYIKNIDIQGTTLTFTRGNNVTTSLNTRDTTYNEASSSQAGLMSALDKQKLNGIAAGATNTPVIPEKAEKLKTARTISITGGGTGSTSFDGSANVSIPLDNINASNITTGLLAKAYGGTGSTDGSIAKLTTARSINGIDFDGSAGVIFSGVCTTASDVAEKTVNIPGFSLTDGALVCIMFNNVNTNLLPYLNVSGTGAKPIYCGADQLPEFTSFVNQIVWFRYIGGLHNDVWLVVGTPAASTHTIYNLKYNDCEGDIRNAIAGGLYYVASIQQWKGKPTGISNGSCLLEVLGNDTPNGYEIQRLMPLNTPSTMYLRYNNGSQGSLWFKYEGVEVSINDEVSQ